ncbi:MAG: VanZ family protein [Bacteroidales bacterium]|nr:VanZ family protein [Bacteroidales bacterium]
MLQKLYRIIFWAGYTAVLFTSILNIKWSLNKIRFNLIAFDLRLDHLLHLSAYFLICMYYLWGQHKGYVLFRNHSRLKFIIATMVLATVTEFVQIFVPARAFNILDWVANVSGIVIGLIVISFVKIDPIKKS